MQVSLTATNGLERRLEVALPAQQVSGEVESRLKKLARTVRLKGFRPGKAPFTVVRQQFGDQVHAEVINDLMRTSFAQAVDKEQLKPATGPRIEPIALTPGADLRYAAVFEVMPEVRLAPLESLEVDRPVATVTDADLTAMLESMRRQRPVFTEATRAAQATDRITVDYDGTVDGKPFEGSEGRDVTFVLGAGQVLADFDTAVSGAAAGDTRTVSIAYPENHSAKVLAGKTAEFKLTVKKVEEQSLPPVDEEFCRAYGVEEGGVEALRAEVRASMERELEGVIRNRVRVQIMDQLYKRNPLELPRALVDEAIQELQLDMARRAGIRDAARLPPRENFTEAARQRVALGLIMGEVIRTLGVTLDGARVQARIEDLAAGYPDPEQARRQYLENADALRQVQSAVLEDQAVDAILGSARVTDKPATFKDLTGFGQNEGNTEQTA